jgi:hypothetical protein
LKERFVCENVREFEPAESPDAGFEGVGAEKTPFRVGDDLHESALAVGGGREFGEMAVEVLLVDEGVVCR